MSKMLICSDLHFWDYSSRNPSNRFRLYQTRIVAKNIIEVAKREGCEYLTLAGDICERPLMHAYIQSEVKKFLDTLSPNFKTISIIFGQHDRSSKSNDALPEDSVLSVMMPPNCYYMDRKIIELEGSRIAFMSWTPSLQMDWIEEPVDILISHATINYDEGNTAFQSQELDYSKFKIAFLGDIHARHQKTTPTGNILVSLGCPIRNKLGDSPESSGCILDLTSKKWDWVNLDPHDLLMKFDTTNILEEEGYKPDLNTWVIYKPDNIFNPNSKTIKVDAWNEIEALVNDAIIKSGLQDIHTEVIKNINSTGDSIDFGFELKSLHLENWRSITDLTLKFNKGDKIYLAGSNGSGKSSLLSGLKYAFMDVSSTQGLLSLKPFIQYGKSYCLTEVEFIYQGNEYRLRRGTNSKDNALWINGEEQKYNNKRAFEEDVRNRFKFIEYLSDFALFDSEHHRFIGGMSPERKNVIISKLLKLDRIDELNSTSQGMLDNIKKERSGWASRVSETEKLLGYIQEKLSLIILPELSKQQLIDLKLEGIELQRRSRLWNEYQTKTANLQGRIQTYTNTLEDLKRKQQTFRDPGLIDSEIFQINQEIQNLNGRIVDLGNIRVNLDYKTRECNNLRNEGNNAWREAQGLSLGRKCSSCGQVIQNTTDMENHRQELLQKIETLRPQIQSLQEEINQLTYLRDNSEQEYGNLNSEIQRLNSEISKRMTEKNMIESVQRDIRSYTNLLDQTNSELSSLGIVEQVNLPADFLEKMSSIENGIRSWELYESSKADLEVKTLEYNNLNSELQKIDQYLNALNAYNHLTGPTGIIYEAIINKLKDVFSDNTVKYVVTRTGKGNKEHLSLTPMFKKGKEEIEYFSCSSGEKTILDLHLLERLISSTGMLVLDETLKNLDPTASSEVYTMLKDFDVNLLILTSHSESVSGFFNRVINLSINSEGLTEIN